MPHGLHGWLKIDLQGLSPELLTTSEIWLLGSDQLGWREVEPQQTKLTAKGMLALLKSCSSIDDAETLRGQLIALPRDQLPKLPEGEYYWHDLIGLRVLDEDNLELGSVREMMETGSNDVLVVDTGDQDDILLPYNASYVLSVDLNKQLIYTRWRRDY